MYKIKNFKHAYFLLLIMAIQKLPKSFCIILNFHNNRENKADYTLKNYQGFSPFDVA